MSGWFAIKHGIRKHPVFKGRPDRLGAWVAMLDEAAFSDVVQDVAGAAIVVRRGELCASQAMLEDITGLSRQQLRTFLSALERAGTIATRPATKSTKSRTIVTFCNYNKYQNPQPSSNQEPTKDQPIKEQGNNIPVGEAEKSAPFDPEKSMWEVGKKILCEAGVNLRQAGAILGKWKKLHGAEAVIVALGKCQREGAIDPVSYCEGVFRFTKKKAVNSGETVTLENGKRGMWTSMGWIPEAVG